MKSVYFVQANTQYGKAYYLPYATACLAAYAWQFKEIQNEYSYKGIVFKRDKISDILTQYINADVVAFSCCDWTIEYTKVFAQKIKEINPKAKIIFGGHSISRSKNILEEYPFVDYLIFGEGERTFKSLLDVFSGREDPGNVPNIAFKKNGKTVFTEQKEYDTLEGYRSAYLDGYFEALFEENPDTEFCATIETNRGCPYQCAFCNWCYSKKIRQFDLEKVKAEIVWCAEHKIEYVFCADANFGLLKRDYEIAEFVVKVKNKYGYPLVFNNCFAKNSNDTVFKISKLFFDNNLNKAATLSYQSVNPVALKNIGRENFTVEAFADLVKQYNESGIPTYTELILGLPGETYESFCDGICLLVEAGQQSALTVYHCQVYSNSLMGSKAYQEAFGIKTMRVPISFIHTSAKKEGDITEYMELVVSTKEMPFKDIVRAVLFCTCLQCFHYLGLLKFFAIFLNKEKKISYKEFYQKLLVFIFSSKQTRLNQIFESIHRQCCDLSNGEWTYYSQKFGDVGWYLEEGAFMELISEYELFWEEILPFLKQFELENEIFEELLKYQKFSIKLPRQSFMHSEFQYDFYNYFNRALSDEYMPLEKRKNRIEAVIPNPVQDWEEYGRRVMLYAKKKAGTFVLGDSKNVKLYYLE